MSKFSHIDKEGNPTMVDVSDKDVSVREAHARTVMAMPDDIIDSLLKNDYHTAKGPVFQTAILAGTMAAKKTSDLIPLCHPLPITKCQIDITINDAKEIIIDSMVKVSGKTGVEMEALTGCSVAALTIYDMCKAFSHDILIKETKLMHKSGGKRDFTRE